VFAGVDGQDVLRVDDVEDTQGGIGLWARATAATCFNDLSVEVSPPRAAASVPGV
jgi:hypothetical protein